MAAIQATSDLSRALEQARPATTPLNAPDQPTGIDRQQETARRFPSVQLPTTPLPRWGIPDAQQALFLHDQGQFQLSSLLALALTQDTSLSSAMATRVKAITSLAIDWIPANDSAAAKRAADVAASQWRRWVGEQEAEQFHFWILMLGAAIGQIVWERSPQAYVPRFNTWNPTNLFWYWNYQQKFGHWNLITSDGVVEPIPGNGQWVLATTTAKEPWFRGLVRSLTVPFLERLASYQSWSRLNEKYGLAFILNEVPMETPDEYVAMAAADLQNLGSESVVTIRQGAKDDNQWRLGFLQIDPKAFETFRELTSQQAREIAIQILGQPLTQDTGKFGSRAAAEVHNEVRLNLVRADAQMLSSVWSEQLLRPWALANFGDPELAPTLKYVVDEPDTIQRKAGEVSQILHATAQLRKDAPEEAALIDLPRLFAEIGVPVKG